MCKNFFLYFALLFAPALSFSNNLDDDSYPILMKHISGGFVPEDNIGWMHQLIVDNNGHIFMRDRKNLGAEWEQTFIGFIPHNIVSELVHQTAELDDGSMYWPETPKCLDAPVTYYKARNQNGELINFAERVQCRLGLHTDFFQATRFQTILDGLDALYYSR